MQQLAIGGSYSFVVAGGVSVVVGLHFDARTWRMLGAGRAGHLLDRYGQSPPDTVIGGTFTCSTSAEPRVIAIVPLCELWHGFRPPRAQPARGCARGTGAL